MRRNYHAKVIKCRYPGCEERLTKHSTSGVCPSHYHSSVCRCRACLGKGGERDLPDDQKSVKVPGFGTYSGNISYTRVTLPKEPWTAKQEEN